VLSGGERTRLAVARMLLRPSNTLLLDEPTNHLDLDSKEVLLDALVDYGGTLIFVSHDRYFVERLATKIIEVGRGMAVAFPGTYKEFLWHKQHPGRNGRNRRPPSPRHHSPSSIMPKRNVRTRRRDARSEPPRPTRQRSTNWKPKSPRAKTLFAPSNRRCRPLGSTTTARPHSPLSTATMR
jgi:ATP-binding cassette subfamily F protein 3